MQAAEAWAFTVALIAFLVYAYFMARLSRQ
jgi:hypothetical protein